MSLEPLSGSHDRTDVEQITWVLHEYCRLLDDRRADEMVPLVYAADAVDYRRVDRILRGHDQILQMFLTSLETIEATAHLLSNIQISVAGDSAQAFSYVQACHWMRATADLGPVRAVDVVLAGTYRDEFVRTGAGWRIASRRPGFRGPAGLLTGTMPESFLGFAGGPKS